MSATGNLNFYEDNNIDIIQNKREYTKSRNLTFHIEDQNGDPIIFNSCASLYISIVIFRYRVGFVDIMIKELDILKQLLALKYKKISPQIDQ